MAKSKTPEESSLEELTKQVKELTARVEACEGKPKQKKTTTRKPSRYAIFIKENYSNVKSENPNATMGEISKIIAKMWKENKDD